MRSAPPEDSPPAETWQFDAASNSGTSLRRNLAATRGSHGRAQWRTRPTPQPGERPPAGGPTPRPYPEGRSLNEAAAIAAEKETHCCDFGDIRTWLQWGRYARHRFFGTPATIARPTRFRQPASTHPDMAVAGPVPQRHPCLLRFRRHAHAWRARTKRTGGGGVRDEVAQANHPADRAVARLEPGPAAHQHASFPD